MRHYFALLRNKDLAEAYHLCDTFIPQILWDLRIADRQNNVLTRQERKDIDELEVFANNQAVRLNRPEGFVLFG